MRHSSGPSSRIPSVFCPLSRLETSLVILGRKGEAGFDALGRFIDASGIETVPVTADQVVIGCDAFRRFGKGRHPAGLNFGDVFAYALAKTTGQPLLFKGNDFALTDIQVAL